MVLFSLPYMDSFSLGGVRSRTLEGTGRTSSERFLVSYSPQRPPGLS